MDYTIRVEGEAPVLEMPHGLFGLGLKLKAMAKNKVGYPPVGSAYPDIPSAQWTEQDFAPFCPATLNQGQTSACGPHAVAEAQMTSFAMTGEERPQLSAWFCYGVINQGRDDGTSLPDLLKEAQEVGLPLASSVRPGDFSGNYPKAVYDEAKRFRIEAAYEADPLTSLLSSSERRQVSVIGIDIGRNFTPDAAGFIPPFRRSPKGMLGHAISVVGKKYAQGVWWPKILNHWTAQWGLGGYAFLHPSYINPTFGGWTLRVAALDPQDPNRLPSF